MAAKTDKPKINDMKKKFTLFLLLAVSVLMMQAQEEIDKSAWKTQLPRHDIQFGISDPLISGFITENYCIFSKFYGDAFVNSCPVDWFAAPDVYVGPTRTTGTLHLGYTYRVAKWCSVGTIASYTGFFSNVRDRVTNDICIQKKEHWITVMPTVRFSWFNRPCVTMYSGLGMGVSIDVSKRTTNGLNGWYDFNYSSTTSAALALQATFFGVQAGRKWYGFAEIGLGMRGIVTAGFGYHFVSGKVKISVKRENG